MKRKNRFFYKKNIQKKSESRKCKYQYKLKPAMVSNGVSFIRFTVDGKFAVSLINAKVLVLSA